jgi:hypothetical protein
MTVLMGTLRNLEIPRQLIPPARKPKASFRRKILRGRPRFSLREGFDELVEEGLALIE